MGIFFTLFSEAYSCLGYGLLIAAFIVATIYFLLSLASKGIVRSIPFWISLVVLFFAAWINMSVMVGAIKVSSATTAMEMWLNQYLYNMEGIADVKSSQEIGEMLNEEFPILGSYVNLFDFSGYSLKELPFAIAEAVREEMSSQIWSNILWTLGFIVAAVIISLYFDKGEPEYAGRRRGIPPSRNRNNHNYINNKRNGKPHLNRNRRHRL